MKSFISYLYCLSVLLLSGYSSLKAQSPYRFQHLSVNDGLTQNSIWSMCRDQNGYLWVGTADGLNRFNGQEVRSYKHLKGDPYSISGNNIAQITEDKYGHIWVSSDGGLDIYDPVNDRFDVIYAYRGKADVVCRTSFILSEPDGEYLWFKLCDKGIVRFSTRLPSLIHTVKTTVLSNQMMKSVYFSSIGIKGDTAYLSPTGTHLFGYIFKSKRWIHFTFPERNGNRFFGIQNRIYYYEAPMLYEFVPSLEKSIPIAKVSGMANVTNIIQIENQIMMIDENGYVMIHPENNTVIHYRGFMTDREESYYRLSSCLYDTEGVLWMGTDGRGIYYASMYSNKFRLYRSENDDENMVKGICHLGKDKLVVAAYNKGLLVYDLLSGKHINFDDDKSFPKIVNKKFTSVCTATDNLVWICNTGDSTNGLYLVNINNGIGKDYSKLLKSPHKRQMPGLISGYLIQHNGNLFAIDRNTVYEIVKQGNQFRSKVFYSSRTSNLTCIYFSKDNQLAFIGSNERTMVMNLKTKQVYNLAQNGVQITKSIAEDLTGNYYVATTYGVYVYNHDLKPLKVLTVENGLADNFNYGILCDHRGALWLSHNKGISKYQPDSNKFVHFDVRDGLQSNEFNTGAFYAHQGVMYFGGINGINAVVPEKAISNPNLPKVRLTGIKLFDEPLKTDTQPDILHTLKLSFQQNTLSFEFAALEFANFSNNTYSYIMEGYDKNWIRSGSKRFARYANLPPGQYRFKVMGANADEVWNTTPAILEIIITPPFWQTVWFDLIAILFGFIVTAGIIYLIYQRQQLKVKREQDLQRKLDQERIRISRDLHDHVGAQLSYLVTNIEWMKSHPDHLSQEEEVRRLAALEDAGRQAILTLRQTIWAISQHELSLEEFADRFKQYAMRLIEFTNNMQVHFQEDFTSECRLTPAVALNLFRVCQESFNNAVKHSSASNIRVSFSCSDTKYFSCTIKDDGVGFDYDQAISNGHYGLHNMKARTEENGAVLHIDTAINKGTTVIITLSKNTANAV